MSHTTNDGNEDQSGRRKFLGQLAGAATTAALGIGGAGLAIPRALGAAPADEAMTDVQVPNAEHWLDGLKGKHRQLVDGFAPNDGFPLAFAATFLATQGPNPDAGAVVVLRHFAAPLGLTDAVWAKYKIGSTLNITDPATKAAAVRNPFLRPKPGVLLTDEMAVDRLLSHGVIIGVCNVALNVMSGKFAANGGVTPAVAYKEWVAGVIPGVHVLPSGVWGVNRAQEARCTYCSGG